MLPLFKGPLEFWLGSISSPCSPITLTILPLLFPVHSIYPAFQYPNHLASLRAFKHTVPPPSTPPRKDRLAHPWPLQIAPSRWPTISLPTLALPWLLTLVPSITIHNQICWLPFYLLLIRLGELYEGRSHTCSVISVCTWHKAGILNPNNVTG